LLFQLNTLAVSLLKLKNYANCQSGNWHKSIARSKLTTGIFLSLGNAGLWVTELQKALNKKGAAPQLIFDGQFEKGTKDALKAFQKKNGFTADGVSGPQTYKVIGMIS